MLGDMVRRYIKYKTPKSVILLRLKIIRVSSPFPEVVNILINKVEEYPNNYVV